MNKLPKLYIGTNMKMYKTAAQTADYVRALQNLTGDIGRDRLELFAIPSFTALFHAGQCVRDGLLRLGAQNMAWEEEGSFSGEISAPMLRELGIRLVMLGHSERRQLFYETDDMENRKLLCALRNGMTPLLCVGETAEEKTRGVADERLRTQLRLGLRGVGPEDAGRLWIAYEPVWAIGRGGVPAGRDYAAGKHAVIRRCLCELLGEDEGRRVPLLYGGSVDRRNAPELIGAPDIDGLFVGRAAWEAESFNALIRQALPAWERK